MRASIFLLVFILSGTAIAQEDNAIFLYQQRLGQLGQHCEFFADLALDAERNAYPLWKEYDDKTTDCLKDAYEKAKPLFKEAADTADTPELKRDVKTVYARWLTYMQSVGIGKTPSDKDAKRAFQDAKNELTIDMSSK